MILTSEGENGRAGDGEWISRTACVPGAALKFSTVSGKIIFANGAILCSLKRLYNENKQRQKFCYLKRNFSKSVFYGKQGQF